MRIATLLFLAAVACGRAPDPAPDCRATEIVCSYDGGTNQLYCNDPPRRLLESAQTGSGTTGGYYSWSSWCN